MKQPLLAFDIGNSTIGVSLYPNVLNGKNFHINKFESSCVKSSALSASVFSAIQDLFMQRDKPINHQPEIGVVISSVVPRMNLIAISAIKKFCRDKSLRIPEILIVDFNNSGGLSFEVRNPETVGADRIANAVAGFYILRKPVIVVDVGTATTISVVGKTGNFMGGTIMPGVDMMRDSLSLRTAKLPSVTFSKPSGVMGCDTESAIASGILNGTAGAIQNIIAGIERETHTKYRVILTGGRTALVSPLLKPDHLILPDLIYEGMRIIYLRHTRQCVY